MITVPTTASRFALLQIDSDSDSDASDAGKTSTKGGRDGKPRQGKAGAVGAKAGQCNGKKKDKKKKKREQQQSEANEVSDRYTCSPSDLCVFVIRLHTTYNVSLIWQTRMVNVLLCCFSSTELKLNMVKHRLLSFFGSQPLAANVGLYYDVFIIMWDLTCFFFF